MISAVNGYFADVEFDDGVMTFSRIRKLKTASFVQLGLEKNGFGTLPVLVADVLTKTAERRV